MSWQGIGRAQGAGFCACLKCVARGGEAEGWQQEDVDGSEAELSEEMFTQVLACMTPEQQEEAQRWACRLATWP